MRNLLIILVCFCALTIPRFSQACGVCVELPDASLADHILAAEVIVLAAPSPDNPFRFSAKSIVKGSKEKLNSLPEIPFLIDSVTRRAFRSDPSKTVLLTYGPSRSDKAGRSYSRDWRRIFLLNADRAEFVEKLRSTGESWTYGTTDRPDRVSFFAAYLFHRDHVLHTTAMVEIGRAPYALIRPIGERFTTSQILREFNNLNRFIYRPVAIRLLGLQIDPEARAIVRSRYARSLKSGGLNVVDWALAGVEADGVSAVRAIGLGLQKPERALDDKKSLIRALTEVGSSQSEYRAEIVQILSDAIERDAELALQIAIATRNWDQSVLHPQFEVVAALTETDFATQFFLNMVLGADVPTDETDQGDGI